MAQNNAVAPPVEEPANNNAFILPDEVFGPPEYAPVSFENLEQDTVYLVRMTTPDLAFVDLALQTTHAENWRTAVSIRPYLIATRNFKRVFDLEKLLENGIIIPDGEEAEEDENGNAPLHVADVAQHENEILTFDEFIAIVGDYGDTDATFKRLPYAMDANEVLVPEDWKIHDFDLIYSVSKDFIKMEISDAEYGYVFFKKVEQVGGKRRHTRRCRSIRRRRSTRRQRRSMRQRR